MILFSFFFSNHVTRNAPSRQVTPRILFSTTLRAPLEAEQRSSLLTARISYRALILLPLPFHHEAERECEVTAKEGRQPEHKQSQAQLDSLQAQRRQYLLQGSDKLAHDEDL